MKVMKFQRPKWKILFWIFRKNLAIEYDGLTDSSGDEEYLLNNLDSELDVRVIHPPKAPPKDY